MSLNDILVNFQAFLAANTASSIAYREVVADLVDSQQNPLAFGLVGGAARDIDVDGATADPRNFNLVVQTGLPQIRELLTKYEATLASSRLGFTFTHGGKDFVVNTLRNAPDFRGFQGVERSPKNRTFENLMKAVFTNLDAIIIVTRPGDPTKGEGPIVYEAFDNGYLASKSSNTIEVVNSRSGDARLQGVRMAELKKRYAYTVGTASEDWAERNEKRLQQDVILQKAQEVVYGQGNANATIPEVKTTLNDAAQAAKARRGPPP